MAAAWFRHLCEQRKLSFVQVRSAGTAATDGAPMSREVRAVLADEDVSAGPHRSRALSARLLRESDLVITMTESHRSRVLDILPEAAGKTVTLLGLIDQRGGIPDPIGGDVAEYARCLDAMKPALDALADRLAASHDNGTGPTTTR
ncbi:MAG: hypothetical protein A3K19_23180 [Lentisphaerae bacterium RIFOXYB12_FULL_65_16]|nr:MAG: hypothetical protein A3K19_23180 [Lentisphaerae bacterium RIFOXYB12_FULL_65_16]